MAHCR